MRGRNEWQGRLRTLAAAVLAVAVVLGAVLVEPAAADAAPAADATPLTKPRALIVDPGSGRVFVAADDAVIVLSATGAVLKTIDGIGGAWGMDAAQGYIWVNASKTGSIAKIDPDSMTVVQTFATGAALGDNLAIVGHTAWIGSVQGWSGIGRFDLITSVFTTIGSYNAPAAAHIGSSSTEVLVYERNITGGPTHRLLIDDPYGPAVHGQSVSGVRSMVVSADGTTSWSGTYRVWEYDASTLAPTGTTYPAPQATGPIAWSPGHGGTIASTSNAAVHAFHVGTAAPAASIPLTGAKDAKSLALSPDGDTAYVLTTAVQILDLRPSIDARAPASAVRNVPSRITVTGSGLGATDSATIGGVPAVLEGVAPDEVVLTLPAGVPLGTQPLVLSGPTGSASTTVSVDANTGAVLDGTVRLRSDPVAAAQLTLSGGALASPITTTAGPDGTYAFPAVAYGTTYSLLVHDPSDRAPDQTIRPITLQPNAGTTVDADLSKPARAGSELARTPLGTGTVNELLVDPATGTVVVAVGDQIALLDPDGAVLARLRGMYGARSLTMMGTDVYALLREAGRVVRIDLGTRSVTGSWPVGRVGSTIAAAGGRIWFAEDQTYLPLLSLDPGTGAVTRASMHGYSGLVVRSVIGDPDRFTLTNTNLSSYPTAVFEADGSEVSLVAGVDRFDQQTTPSNDVVPVAGVNRIYDAAGHEFNLSNMTDTGVVHPASGPPAYSPGRDGVVAIGTSVAQAGIARLTHAFGGSSVATGLNAAGTRLYTVDANQLRVSDLSPEVTGFDRSVLHPDVAVALQGSGLGAISAVTIDGAPAEFDGAAPGSVSVEIPDLSPGIHELIVTTPWGDSAPVPLDIVATSVPAPPGPPTAVLAGKDVRITWPATSDDGGKPVTGYTVLASPGGATCTTAGALTCVLTTLTPGSVVTFTVTAENELGSSEPSPESSEILVPVPPSAPTGVHVTAGPSRVEVSWTPPTDSGGAPVAWYEICTSTDASMPAATKTCAKYYGSSAWITGLIPGTAYYVTVAAVNAVGTGPPSPTSGGTVPYTVAPAPTALTITPKRMSADVSWTPPSTDGGSPITGYRVCASTDPAMPQGSQTPCMAVGPVASATMTGLTGGAGYHFTVATTNAAGTGPASPTAPATIPVTTPGAPTGAAANAGASSITVTWFPPTGDGGSPITGYRVCLSSDPAMPEASTTCSVVPGPSSAKVTGLSGGTRRYATVAAVNAIGTGPASAVSSGVDPDDVPGAPTAVAAVGGNGQARITWTAPAHAGLSPVSFYRITPYIGSTPQPYTAVAAGSTELILHSLANGTAYTFVVTAGNYQGIGAPSAPSNVVTPLVNPAAPFSSWDAFVAQQLSDFAGAVGTSTSRVPAVTSLSSGTVSPGAFISAKVDDPWFSPNLAPVARLYWAYFGRTPDHSGMTYWAGKRRTGTSLVRISRTFAASNEFKTKYGSLSNRTFVLRIYTAVLGRPADPSGVDYWTRKLDQGTPRGQVMVNFSESNEYRNKVAGKVGVVLVYAAMLRRAPSAEELASWQTHPVLDVIEAILAGTEYADRVS